MSDDDPTVEIRHSRLVEIVDLSEQRLAEVAALKRRIRLARREALGQGVSRSLWELLDLRRPVRP